MSQKDKKTCFSVLIVALMLAVVSTVSLGSAAYEDYADVPAEAVCNDIDMDGFVATSADLPVDWDGIMSPSCPWLIMSGDCDNYDIDAWPGAPETLGDGVDQDCNGVAE